MAARASPSMGFRLPRPMAQRLGTCRPRCRTILPSVSLPTSPYAAASGISPTPTLSRTIQIMRENTNSNLTEIGIAGCWLRAREGLITKERYPTGSTIANIGVPLHSFQGAGKRFRCALIW